MTLRMEARTVIRPFVRKHGDWWLIHVGRTDYVLGSYYTSAATAHDAAVRYAAKENAWR